MMSHAARQNALTQGERAGRRMADLTPPYAIVFAPLLIGGGAVIAAGGDGPMGGAIALGGGAYAFAKLARTALHFAFDHNLRAVYRMQQRPSG